MTCAFMNDGKAFDDATRCADAARLDRSQRSAEIGNAVESSMRSEPLMAAMLCDAFEQP
jgi:hypothetical protein